MPVYVRLPASLTDAVAVPWIAAPKPTNEDLLDLCERQRGALWIANKKFAKIRSLQP